MKTTNSSRLQMGAYDIFNIINKRPEEEKSNNYENKPDGHLKHN